MSTSDKEMRLTPNNKCCTTDCNPTSDLETFLQEIRYEVHDDDEAKMALHNLLCEDSNRHESEEERRFREDFQLTETNFERSCRVSALLGVETNYQPSLEQNCRLDLFYGIERSERTRYIAKPKTSEASYTSPQPSDSLRSSTPRNLDAEDLTHARSGANEQVDPYQPFWCPSLSLRPLPYEDFMRSLSDPGDLEAQPELAVESLSEPTFEKPNCIPQARRADIVVKTLRDLATSLRNPEIPLTRASDPPIEQRGSSGALLPQLREACEEVRKFMES